MTTTFPPVQPPRKNHTKLGLVVATGLVMLAIIGLVALAIAAGLHNSLPSPPTAQPTTTQADPTDRVDPTDRDVWSYLQSLHDEGITGINGDDGPVSINGDDSLVNMGDGVCADLGKGYTHLQEVNALLEANPGLYRKEAMKIVIYANVHLCVNVDPFDTTIPPLAQQ